MPHTTAPWACGLSVVVLGLWCVGRAGAMKKKKSRSKIVFVILIEAHVTNHTSGLSAAGTSCVTDWSSRCIASLASNENKIAQSRQRT